MTEYFTIVYICYILFIHSSTDGHLGCFHVLVIIHSAAVILGCMYLFELEFSPDVRSRVVLLGHMAALFFLDSFLGKTPYCFPWRRQWHPTPVLLLENPMDGGAWWAAVHGVTKSRT